MAQTQSWVIGTCIASLEDGRLSIRAADGEYGELRRNDIDEYDYPWPWDTYTDEIKSIVIDIEECVVDERGRVPLIKGNQLFISISEDEVREILEEHAAFLEGMNANEGNDIAKRTNRPADLRGYDLSFAAKILNKTDLSYANLAGANLSDVNMSYAVLKNANLRRACMEKTIMASAHMENANLEHVKLTDAFLDYTNMSMAKLDEAKLQNTHMYGVIMEHASLRKADMSGSNLEEANLQTPREKAHGFNRGMNPMNRCSQYWRNVFFQSSLTYNLQQHKQGAVQYKELLLLSLSKGGITDVLRRPYHRKTIR